MIGMFISSKAGHDKNTIYIIIKDEGEYVYLVDGKYKTIQKPKKKSKKHIQMIQKYVDIELIEKLKSNCKVYDEELKRALKNFEAMRRINGSQEKKRNGD